MNNRITALICIVFSLAMNNAVAAETIPWGHLNDDQQRLLQPVEGDWPTMGSARQNLLLRGANRWLDMGDDAREQAAERFDRFNALPTGQQEFLRGKFREFVQMSPESRARVRAAANWFRSRTSEERDSLRQQWDNMSAEDRRDFLNQRRQNVSGNRSNRGGGNRPESPNRRPANRRPSSR